MIGSTVSHYAILEKLGEGGMGIVYKAEDLKLTRTVALKFLPHGLTSHQADRARFLQEARAAAILNHPNVCTVYDIQEHEGEQFIVMEYVNGMTLRSRISEGGFRIEQAVEWAIQIAEALNEAHVHGIVHRDIKAENIMVNTKNQVKVMDFGLAKLKGSLKLTRSSSTIGTLAYMAPEQLQGADPDARSDIFSLGVVLYEMLTGRTPFRGEHEAALMYSILNEQPEPLQRFLPDAPSELLHVVNRALEKDPEERYQSVHEMLIDLRRLRKDSSRIVRPASDLQSPVASEPSAHRRTLVGRPAILIAAGALVVAIIAGWLLFHPGGGLLTGSPATKERSIAVMYFENRTEEKNLDRILVEMLITNLGRDKQLTVVSSQRLFDILKALGKQNDAVIDRSTATDVATRAGVRTMLLGSIWSVGGKLDVTTQLLDVTSGEVLNSRRIEISKPDEIFSAADQVTDNVAHWLRGTSSDTLHVVDATTGSYAAYRLYERGLNHAYRFEHGKATECFVQATRLDSTFALAHLWLSIERGIFTSAAPFPSASVLLARASVATAQRYARNLSERDRLIIDAWAATLQRNETLMGQRLTEGLQKFPDTKDFLFLKSWMESDRADPENAVRWMEKAIELDRSYSDGYNILGYQYAMQRKYDHALSAVRTYVAVIPDAYNAYDSWCDISMMAGRFDEAIQAAEEGIKHNPTWLSLYGKEAQAYMLWGDFEKARERLTHWARLDTGSASSIDRLDALSHLFEGQPSRSLEALRRRIERARARNLPTLERSCRFDLGRLLMASGRYREALKELDAIRSWPEEAGAWTSAGWSLRCDYYSGLCLTRTGELDQARARAEAIRSTIANKALDAYYLHSFHGLMAEIHLAGGNGRLAQESVDRIEPALRIYFPLYRALGANIHAFLQDKQNALRTLEETRNLTAIAQAPMGGDFFDFWSKQSTLDYSMAKVCEGFGEKAEALAHYQRALQHWRFADKDFPPFVDAKARAATLVQ